MKRLSMALAPALMAGALLGTGVAAQAQSHTLRLADDLPNFVARGETFSLRLIGNTPGTTIATTFQTLFVYDPTKMDVNFTLNPSVTAALVANNAIRTFTVASGPQAGTYIMKQSTFGLSPSTNGLDLDNTLLGTFEVRILGNATGGFMNIGFSDAVLNQVSLPNNRRTLITGGNLPTNFDGSTGNLRPGAFRIGIVPGPSSLAVFALGGLAPAMALIRRRRAR
ncbi:MAG: hypothetical protein RMJ43_06585 [Chloroherpetonaceae bacterium]|nr:hypothetical protein [Chthonomonadaceae bacterium]MDW8207486.1 hypothetical protein [Chloroherpetonaceae bacterium]